MREAGCSLPWIDPGACASAGRSVAALRTLRLMMNYRTGLFSFGPLKNARQLAMP